MTAWFGFAFLGVVAGCAAWLAWEFHHAPVIDNLDVRSSRDELPPSLAWGPDAGRLAYDRLSCGCVQFRHGQPRWLRCPAHDAIAEIETEAKRR